MPMSLKERKALVSLGQLVVRMVYDVILFPTKDVAYATRTVVFPLEGENKSMHLLLIRDAELLDKFNSMIDEKYNTTEVEIKNATNPSD